MAPRRSRKVVKVTKNNVYTDLTLTKIMCPICRTILIEPVSLPCDHNFCLSCFDSTMANANLVCPLCRIRVGSWYRTAKKVNTLVNTELWKAIKEQFATQVKNKLEGIDEIFEDEEKPLIKLATPGEIRKEYEIQKQADEAELKKQRDLETKASEELIRKLAAEEEFEKSVAEEKERIDREIAKEIAKNLWSEAGPSKAPKKQGPLDRFLRKNHNNNNNNSSGSSSSSKKKIVPKDAEISDSSDCIESECRYFKPIDYKNVPPSMGAMSPIKVPAKMGNASGVLGAPQGPTKFYHSPMRSAFTVVRCSSMLDQEKINTRRNGSMCIESNSSTIARVTKRPSIRSDEVIIGSKRAKNNNVDQPPSSPRRLRCRPSKLEKRPVTPPCFGFQVNETDQYLDRHCVIVNNSWESAEMEVEKRRLQEEADLELAKKLQVELNGYGRYKTRLGCNKRQLTLDELIKAQCRIGF